VNGPTLPELPDLRLDGKVAVVTGGSKGLGRAMALGFAAAGADVVVASRKLEGCEQVASEIRSLGRKAIAAQCHVGDWSQCDALIQRTVGEFGHLDVLVNNAGIAPVAPSLKETSEELVDKTFAVNLKGPLRLMGLAAEHLPDGGSIINISSLASLHPTPFTTVYSAAKAALNALTIAAAQELAPKGIRVIAIVCGSFRTDSLMRSVPTEEMAEGLAARVPLGRIASVDEIVGTALFLATDASSYMTGALLTLAGGA
jgi:NAD(P)-dependent dehydrogenase (short-subunit alcohol dehydrogenase family)